MERKRKKNMMQQRKQETTIHANIQHMPIYTGWFIFSPFFLVFKHDFIRCVDFTLIAVSNIASDDVTN